MEYKYKIQISHYHSETYLFTTRFQLICFEFLFCKGVTKNPYSVIIDLLKSTVTPFIVDLLGEKKSQLTFYLICLFIVSERPVEPNDSGVRSRKKLRKD